MRTQVTPLILAIAAVAGCSKSDVQSGHMSSEASAPIVMNEMPPMVSTESHPERGPHGGELVELGKEAFHIEMMHGTGAVALYVLDGSATQAVAIDPGSLTVSLKQNDEVRSFKLSADPRPEDEVGKSSRFTSTEAEMDQWMKAGAEGAVIVQINGRSFTGRISHDHDHDHGHEGHSH